MTAIGSVQRAVASSKKVKGLMDINSSVVIVEGRRYKGVKW